MGIVALNSTTTDGGPFPSSHLQPSISPIKPSSIPILDQAVSELSPAAQA